MALAMRILKSGGAYRISNVASLFGQRVYLFRLVMFKNAKAEGRADEDAARIVWKMFPIYGIPEETDPLTGEDRRLAHEIRGRVD